MYNIFHSQAIYRCKSTLVSVLTIQEEPLWRSSGLHACHLLRRSEFEFRWYRYKKTKIWKEVGADPMQIIIMKVCLKWKISIAELRFWRPWFNSSYLSTYIYYSHILTLPPSLPTYIYLIYLSLSRHTLSFSEALSHHLISLSLSLTFSHTPLHPGLWDESSDHLIEIESVTFQQRSRREEENNLSKWSILNRI